MKKRDMLFAIFIFSLIIFLIITAFPGCSKLLQKRNNAVLGYPSEETITRSSILKKYDFACLVQHCVEDCIADNKDDMHIKRCNAFCSDASKIENNSLTYPQCIIDYVPFLQN